MKHRLLQLTRQLENALQGLCCVQSTLCFSALGVKQIILDFVGKPCIRHQYYEQGCHLIYKWMGLNTWFMRLLKSLRCDVGL